MKAVIDGGDSPDLIMFPQSYEGRDVMARVVERFGDLVFDTVVTRTVRSWDVASSRAVASRNSFSACATA